MTQCPVRRNDTDLGKCLGFRPFEESGGGSFGSCTMMGPSSKALKLEVRLQHSFKFPERIFESKTSALKFLTFCNDQVSMIDTRAVGSGMGRSAHPGPPGACGSPAPHPGTGVSEQSPAAATPSGRSPRICPQATPVPAKAQPCSTQNAQDQRAWEIHRKTNPV